MNSTNIIHTAGHGNSLEQFFYRRTKLGENILNKALTQRYGQMVKKLTNGGYKFVSTKYTEPDVFSHGTRQETTTYLDENFEPTKETFREFCRKTGKRFTFWSKFKTPNGTIVTSRSDDGPTYQTEPGLTGYRRKRQYSFHREKYIPGLGCSTFLESNYTSILYKNVNDTTNKKMLHIKTTRDNKTNRVEETKDLIINV